MAEIQVTVNTSNTERTFIAKEAGKRSEMLRETFDACKLLHPDWMSITLTVVNPDLEK